MISTNSIQTFLDDCPIIAAIHSDSLEAALASPTSIIFLLNANILTVESIVGQIHAVGKKAFVHLDLAEGIGKDKTGIAFLKTLHVDGIISTKSGLIRAAKEQKLITVQRFFALDSQGVSSIEEQICSCNPDLVEIMPGIAVKVVKRLADIGLSVIAGGLIESKTEAVAALSAGALAVSTGKPELWEI